MVLVFAAAVAHADTSASAGQAPLEGKVEPFLGEPAIEIRKLFDGQRFPNVVVAMDGSLIASWGSNAIAVRRSEDGGETWGDPIPVAEKGIHGGGVTVDEINGHIWMFVEARHPPAALTIYRSKDHGVSWDQVEDVVIHADDNDAVPSMHMNERGITLRHGDKAGRLIRAARSYGGGNAREFWPGHYTNAIYSDDRGATWHTSAPFPAMGTGEAALVELSDGTIYYNSRRHHSTDGKTPRMRYVVHSRDGGHSWQDLSISQVLPDGPQDSDYGLMAGLVRLPVAGRDILVFSNIDSPSGRRNGTVWASFDGGKSWPLKRVISPDRFAYSSLAAGRPGTAGEGWIYLFYEDAGGSIARFNLSWLLQGEATGDGDVPGWVGGLIGD